MITRLALDQLISWMIYFYNTIDSYFLFGGLASLIILLVLFKKERKMFFKNKKVFLPLFFFYAIFLLVIYKLADFFPYFIFFTPIFLYFLFKTKNFSKKTALKILLVNIVFFFVTQFFIHSGAFVFILKDITIPFRVMFFSLFSINPTTSSAPIALYFATLFTLTVYFKPSFHKDKNAIFFIISLLVAAVITASLLPTTPESVVFHPKIEGKISDRVILITVDGWRFDKFKEALDEGKLPSIKKLIEEGVYFENGASSIYRALTEPGLASFLTGLPPEDHEVRDNNHVGGLEIVAIPDVVETKLYGNIHMADIGKEWGADVTSLSKHGWNTDDVVFRKLKKDIVTSDAKFFFIDLGDVDLTGHAYGGFTNHYIEANKRLDRRIGDLINFLDENNLLDSTTIIISSEHGHVGMDHGYFLFYPEKYVPLILYGNGIKKGITLDFVPSIIDVNPTIMYILGLDYLEGSRGRVLIEAFD